MDVDRLADWVSKQGEAVAKYADVFRRTGINGDIFADMTDQQLQKLGVHKVARTILLLLRDAAERE